MNEIHLYTVVPLTLMHLISAIFHRPLKKKSTTLLTDPSKQRRPSGFLPNWRNDKVRKESAAGGNTVAASRSQPSASFFNKIFS